MNRTLAFAVAIASAILLALASPARAQNLIANGFFDSNDMAGWYAIGGYGAHEHDLDVDAWTQSGSAVLWNQSYAAAATASLWRCVGWSEPFAEYFLEARVGFASDQWTTGSATVSIEFYSQGGCSGTPLDTFTTSAVGTVSARGRWASARIGSYASGFQSAFPYLSTSMAIRLSVQKQNAGGDLAAYFDSLVLARTGVPLCRGQLATQFGTEGPDHIVGTAGNDVLVGLGGRDRIEGRGGNDLICGGDGKDTLLGGGGADTIYGDHGNDTVRGNSGSDKLFGGPGDDVLTGAAGQDQIYGGPGADAISGGAEYDGCYPGGGDVAPTAGCEWTSVIELP